MISMIGCGEAAVMVKSLDVLGGLSIVSFDHLSTNFAYVLGALTTSSRCHLLAKSNPALVIMYLCSGRSLAGFIQAHAPDWSRSFRGVSTVCSSASAELGAGEVDRPHRRVASKWGETYGFQTTKI